ncbi:hypothetical protein EG329_012203 [Mollisiaceae sp. DMI_Dod_QoI]|nr:hypothetical protein EG329_012203 [Helotiales sp. DMI_Dod_QoI]
MSLGSRITKRGKAAVIASLVSTPREPLFFLYPQWVRKSSTASPAAAAQRSRDNSGSKAAIHEASSKPKTPFVTSHPNDSRSLRRRSNGDTIHYQPRALSPNTPQSAKSLGSEALSSDIIFAEKVPTDVPDPSSILVDSERIARQILSAANKREIAQQNAHARREEYQENRRERTQNWLPDWRVILKDLLNNTPPQGEWFERQIQIVVPPSATEKFLTSLDNYIWDIGNKYGCSIALGRRPSTQSQHGVFILSGSKIGISRTLGDVLRIAPDAKIMMAESPHVPHPQSQPPLSGLPATTGVKVRDVLSTVRRKAHPVLPDQIRRPTIWTPTSFLDYVKALTTLNLPNNQGKKHDDHWSLRLKILRDLFRNPDPNRRAAITRAACHEALRFFAKHNQIEDVRLIFVRMELFGLQTTPETFNIMLRSAAKQEDLHNFHFVLHLMLRRGLTPNGETWTAFMMLLLPIKLKIHVADAMRKKGLLQHRSTMKAVCQQLIRPEVEWSIDADQDQNAFISHMDSRYGREWLTLDSGNLVLHELGSRGLISRCWDFLRFMDSRFIPPDQYSINIILNHCNQIVNLEGAIELMHNIVPSWGFKPDIETFRILFALAWKTRSYNIAKMVWKYACLSGKTSFGMRDRVLESMLAVWRKDPPSTPRHRFNCYAGSVIFGAYVGLHPIHSIPKKRMKHIGTGPGVVNGKDDVNDKPNILAMPPSYLPLYRPLRYTATKFRSKELEEHLKLVEREFWLDVQMTLSSVSAIYASSFQDMLGTAMKLDKTWRENGDYRERDLQWLIENALRVPIIVSQSGRELRLDL